MAHLQELEGIVLSKRKYKERDFLVKLFLKDVGKLMFYVRGSKNPNQSLNHIIEPFTYATYIVDLRKSGLSFIRDAKQVEPYTVVQHDIFKNAYATYICGLIDASMEDRKIANPLFNQLHYGLEAINNGLDAEIIMNIFEVKLLYYFGVMPQLHACVICGNPNGPFDFSSKFGGILCQHHFHEDEHRLYADPRSLFYMNRFLNINLENLENISVADVTKQNIQSVIDYIYDESVGIRLKSKEFIRQMNKWGKLLQDD